MACRRRGILYGLIIATACFAVADEIADIALTWIIVSHTGSAGWTGLAGAIGMVPLIAGAFFGGALVDRLGMRRMALLAGFLGLAVAVAIPVMLGQLGVVLPLLLASIFAAELFDVPAEIAIEAQLPELARFGRMPLERVNALDELVETLAALAGPLLAGLAMSRLGAIAALWTVAAVAAAGVAVLCCALPRRRNDPARRRSAARPLSIGDGWRLIWTTPVLRWITLVAALLTTLLVSLEGVLLPVLMQQSGRSALDLGWVLAAAGGGAAVGTAGYAWKGHLMSPRAVVFTGILGLAGSTAALALFTQTGPVCVAAALGGMAAGPMSPLLNSQVQRHAPRALRGRVLGIATGVILLCMPAGLLGLGVAAELFGARAALIGTAAAFAGAGFLALASRTLADMQPDARSGRMTQA